jgi:hypothetical protein
MGNIAKLYVASIVLERYIKTTTAMMRAIQRNVIMMMEIADKNI